MELELELKAIRNEGNIIAYEKKAKVPDNGTLTEERVGKFKEDIENWRLALNDACKMVQPTQASISVLSDRTEAAKYFVSSMIE